MEVFFDRVTGEFWPDELLSPLKPKDSWKELHLPVLHTTRLIVTLNIPEQRWSIVYSGFKANGISDIVRLSIGIPENEMRDVLTHQAYRKLTDSETDITSLFFGRIHYKTIL